MLKQWTCTGSNRKDPNGEARVEGHWRLRGLSFGVRTSLLSIMSIVIKSSWKSKSDWWLWHHTRYAIIIIVIIIIIIKLYYYYHWHQVRVCPRPWMGISKGPARARTSAWRGGFWKGFYINDNSDCGDNGDGIIKSWQCHYTNDNIIIITTITTARFSKARPIVQS